MTHQQIRRGDDTREALINAGFEVFGRCGFHAASSRDLAGTAGVNQALIGYHFGGKEGLYLAVFEALTSAMQVYMAPVEDKLTIELAEIEQLSSGRADRCLLAMEQLLFTFVNFLIYDATTDMAKLVTREQQEPSKAFDIIYKGGMSRILNLLSRFIALQNNEGDKPSEQSRLCALMLVGQVLVFRVARETATRHMSWESGVNDEGVAMIQMQIRWSLHAAFGGGAML